MKSHVLPFLSVTLAVFLGGLAVYFVTVRDAARRDLRASLLTVSAAPPGQTASTAAVVAEITRRRAWLLPRETSRLCRNLSAAHDRLEFFQRSSSVIKAGDLDRIYLQQLNLSNDYATWTPTDTTDDRLQIEYAKLAATTHQLYLASKYLDARLAGVNIALSNAVPALHLDEIERQGQQEIQVRRQRLWTAKTHYNPHIALQHSLTALRSLAVKAADTL